MEKSRDYWLEQFNELFNTNYKSVGDIPGDILWKAIVVLMAAIELTDPHSPSRQASAPYTGDFSEQL